MLICHFLSSSQERKNVLLILRHNSNFRDICTELLHLAKAAYDIILIRSLEEIVVRCYDLNACSMSSLDDPLYDLVTCEDFNVYHVNIACLCSPDVDIGIYFILDGLFPTFLRSTECHQDRCVAEDLTKSLHDILECSEVEYVLEPVDSPLNNICRKLCDRTCFL